MIGSPTILDTWSFTSAAGCPPSVVLPDGCRDLIFTCSSGSAPGWKISQLFDSAFCTGEKSVAIHMTGYRFSPDTTIQSERLLRELEKLTPEDHGNIIALVSEFATGNNDVREALAYIAQGQKTVDQYARACGISRRSFQRLLLLNTGRSPVYWRQLARIRLAGRLLGKASSLAEAAADAGFSDQAHMSREFIRWFGIQPDRFRSDTILQKQLTEPAYA